MDEQSRARQAMDRAGVDYVDRGSGFFVRKLGHYVTSGEVLGRYAKRLGI